MFKRKLFPRRLTSHPHPAYLSSSGKHLPPHHHLLPVCQEHLGSASHLPTLFLTFFFFHHSLLTGPKLSTKTHPVNHRQSSPFPWNYTRQSGCAAVGAMLPSGTWVRPLVPSSSPSQPLTVPPWASPAEAAHPNPSHRMRHTAGGSGLIMNVGYTIFSSSFLQWQVQPTAKKTSTFITGLCLQGHWLIPPHWLCLARGAHQGIRLEFCPNHRPWPSLLAVSLGCPTKAFVLTGKGHLRTG